MTIQAGDRVIMTNHYPTNLDADNDCIPIGARGVVLSIDGDTARVSWDYYHACNHHNGTYQYIDTNGTQHVYTWCVQPESIRVVDSYENVDEAISPVIQKIRSLKYKHKHGNIRTKTQRNRLAFISQQKSKTAILSELLKGNCDAMPSV